MQKKVEVRIKKSCKANLKSNLQPLASNIQIPRSVIQSNLDTKQKATLITLFSFQWTVMYTEDS